MSVNPTNTAPPPSTTASTRADWLLFVLLGFFWGSSYLFIKIGVDAGIAPFTLVALRLLVGALLLATVVFAAREKLPRDPRTYGHFIVLGILSVSLPFVLITVAEQSVDSALAAILTAPVPLFVIPIAAVVLHERITPNKVLGVLVGLVGVAILVGFDPATLGQTDLTPQLILLAAAFSYAMGGVYARRFVHGLRPMIPALFQVTFAMIIAGTGAFLFENPIGHLAGIPPEGWFSVIWLGLLGSGMAYLLFYRLLGAWGPTRTSLVAYLLPIWGIALGWIVLGEQIGPGIILGTALVIGGIALVNVKRQTFTDWLNRRRTGPEGETQVKPAP
ncbi:MAG TPA: DMT family transporter [Candidatus Limnocylindrales bacterium]|nr:DMT family transporter [Candidatus Limnocylindrales bacterium]